VIVLPAVALVTATVVEGGVSLVGAGVLAGGTVALVLAMPALPVLRAGTWPSR
jgi:hypothetical protein